MKRSTAWLILILGIALWVAGMYGADYLSESAFRKADADFETSYRQKGDYVNTFHVHMQEIRIPRLACFAISMTGWVFFYYGIRSVGKRRKV